MEISRRNFIKTGITGLLGGIIVYGSVSLLLRNSALADITPDADLNGYDGENQFWAFIVDIGKCIGCGKCVIACKLENGVPLESENNRTWIERYVITEDEEIFVDSPDGGINGFTAEPEDAKYKNLKIQKSFFVPKLCNQCKKPPCLRVCPVGATYQTKERVVLVDRNTCIGCRYCIQACPYGARYFLHAVGVVDKCTWCYHRITKGLLPACVEVCPAGARVFGDMSDPEGPVRRMLKEQTIGVLKPEVGCEAQVFYIGLEKGVR
ncbi:MAG: 4Fe-4S dicluster domain-containing protein [Planctomycetota bacterium]